MILNGIQSNQTRKTHHALNISTNVLCWNTVIPAQMKHTVALREHQIAGLIPWILCALQLPSVEFCSPIAVVWCDINASQMTESRFGEADCTLDESLHLVLVDENSTLVQAMAWCPPATSHYLGQCLPSSMSPYGFTRVKHKPYI